MSQRSEIPASCELCGYVASAWRTADDMIIFSHRFCAVCYADIGEALIALVRTYRRNPITPESPAEAMNDPTT